MDKNKAITGSTVQVVTHWKPIVQNIGAVEQDTTRSPPQKSVKTEKTPKTDKSQSKKAMSLKSTSLKSMKEPEASNDKNMYKGVPAANMPPAEYLEGKLQEG